MQHRFADSGPSAGPRGSGTPAAPRSADVHAAWRATLGLATRLSPACVARHATTLADIARMSQEIAQVESELADAYARLSRSCRLPQGQPDEIDRALEAYVHIVEAHDNIKVELQAAKGRLALRAQALAGTDGPA